MATANDAHDVTAPAALRRLEPLVHVLAVGVIAVGVIAQFSGPSPIDVGQPADPSTAFDAAYLARARAYRYPLYAAAAAVVVLRLAVPAFFVFTGRGRAAAARLVERGGGQQRPARAAALVVTSLVVVTDLVLLPVEFWAGYVHDGRFGLRSQGLGGWLYDWAVLHLPVWLGVALATLLGYWIARRLPRVWAPVCGIGAGLVSGLLVFVSPFVLEPLLYRFTPLPQGPVRTEIERVLDRAGEDVDAILVADASRRSVRQNAYVSGFGASERVVLYDTLVEEREPAETAVILAHELAHKRNGDVVRYLLLSVAGGGIAAYLLWLLLRERTGLGLQRSPADPAAAAVVFLAVVVMTIVAMPVQAAISRRVEAVADGGSLEYTADPVTFAQMHRALARTNLSDPLPPALVTWYWGTHPPTMARLALARHW